MSPSQGRGGHLDADALDLENDLATINLRSHRNVAIAISSLWRASHCTLCGFCFARYDHHCPLVGTCVSRR